MVEKPKWRGPPAGAADQKERKWNLLAKKHLGKPPLANDETLGNGAATKSGEHNGNHKGRRTTNMNNDQAPETPNRKRRNRQIPPETNNEAKEHCKARPR